MVFSGNLPHFTLYKLLPIFYNYSLGTNRKTMLKQIYNALTKGSGGAEQKHAQAENFDSTKHYAPSDYFERNSTDIQKSLGKSSIIENPRVEIAPQKAKDKSGIKVDFVYESKPYTAHFTTTKEPNGITYRLHSAVRDERGETIFDNDTINLDQSRIEPRIMLIFHLAFTKD